MVSSGRAARLAAGGMPLHSTSVRSFFAVTCLALLASPPSPSSRALVQDPAGAGAASAVAIDIVAVERDGRFIENLRASDLTVTVDGRPRPVLWVRRVSRGPGAIADAASRHTGGEGPAAFAAEPRRTVLVVVDQASLARGDERGFVQAARRVRGSARPRRPHFGAADPEVVRRPAWP